MTEGDGLQPEACPDDGTLWLLVEGQVAAEDAEGLRRHLDRCPSCQSAAAALLRATGEGPDVVVPSLQDGALLAGRYRLDGRLGAGAMGTVHRAHDLQLGRDVALKLLSAGRGTSARLVREAKAMASLRHPQVVTVFDAFVDEGRLVIAMELYEGGTLRSWVDPPHPWPAVCRVLLDAGRGLHAAHEAGWIHRDFKPDNILLDGQGRAHVADFGLVRALEDLDMSRTDMAENSEHGDSAATSTGHALGTPVYMAPEQARAEAVDRRADVHAFCVTAYELLTGRRPFSAISHRALIEAKLGGRFEPIPRSVAPRVVAAIVHAGLAPDPDDRPPSLEVVCMALERALRPRRTRVGLAVGALALGGLGLGRWLADDPCASRAPLWTPARAEAGHLAWPDDGAQERADAALADFSSRWQEAWEEGCASESATRECLSLQYDWVDASARANGAGSIPPQFLLGDIPSVEHCSGRGPLVLRRLPDTELARVERDEVRQAVARALNERMEGRAREAREALLALTARADALGDPWALAELDHALGEAAFVLEQRAESEAALLRAVEWASAAEHGVVAVRSQLLLSTLAEQEGDHALERVRLDAAAVALRRLEGTPMHGALLAMLDDVEASAALRVGDLPEARRRLQRALEHARRHTPERVAARLGEFARLELAEGDVHRALARYEEALSLVGTSEDDALEREVLELNFAALLVQVGQLERALQHTRVAAGLAEASGTPSFEAGTNEVSILVALGRLEEARRMDDALLETLSAHPEAPPRHRVIALRVGLEIEEALGHHQRCADRAAELRTDPAFELDDANGVNVQLLQASCLLALGQRVRALDVADGAVTSAARVPETPTLSSLAHAMRAEVHLADARSAAALEETSAALDGLPAEDPWSMRAYLETVHTRALWGAGRRDEARALATTLPPRLEGEDLRSFETWLAEVGLSGGPTDPGRRAEPRSSRDDR